MKIIKNGKEYTTGQENIRRCKSPCPVCNGIINQRDGYCHVDKSTFIYTHKECKDDYLQKGKISILGTTKKHGIIFEFKVSLYNINDMANLREQGFTQVGTSTLIATFSGLNKSLNTDFKFNHCRVKMIDTLLNETHVFKFNHSTFNKLKVELLELAIEKGLKDRWRYS